MSISEKCADFIVKYREKISRVFWGLLGISLILCLFVQVNYDLSKYLPNSSLTQQGIQKMGGQLRLSRNGKNHAEGCFHGRSPFL